MSGQQWWSCEIHRAEGLAVVRKVLRADRGGVRWRDGVLMLDDDAFAHLVHLGTVGDQDGAIVWADDAGHTTTSETGVPRVRFGRYFYPVMACP